VSETSYRVGARGISIPATGDALERITAGEAKDGDWKDLPPGAPCDPPDEVRKELIARKLIVRERKAKEVRNGD
jgi:hypothetical protein